MIGWLAPWAPVEGRVFFARETALAEAFPAGTEVTGRDFFLTQAQKRAIETASGCHLDTDLITLYEGRKQGAVVGYAYFDSRTVRTLRQTLLTVIAPSGMVRKTLMCAFHEPQEYLPTGRWFGQLHGKSDPGQVRVGRGVAAVAGATLSARSITESVRMSLAVVRVCLLESPAGS